MAAISDTKPSPWRGPQCVWSWLHFKFGWMMTVLFLKEKVPLASLYGNEWLSYYCVNTSLLDNTEVQHTSYFSVFTNNSLNSCQWKHVLILMMKTLKCNKGYNKCISILSIDWCDISATVSSRCPLQERIGSAASPPMIQASCPRMPTHTPSLHRPCPLTSPAR